MTREEMIRELKAIKVGVQFVALTSEGALECTCVTRKGSSYEWFSLYDWQWPVYEVSFPDVARTEHIKQQLRLMSLDEKDIKDTELESLYFSCVPEEERDTGRLNEFFSYLKLFSIPESKSAFVLFDDCKALFFDNEDEVDTAFSEQWGVTPWDEYTDEQLEEFLADISSDFYDPMPVVRFSDE